jgi:hypothetical protein
MRTEPDLSIVNAPSRDATEFHVPILCLNTNRTDHQIGFRFDHAGQVAEES